MYGPDTPAYRSKLRDISPELKAGFAVLSLMNAVISCNLCVPLLILTVNSILIVYISGLSFRRYLQYLTIPAVFCIMSCAAILFQWKPEPLDLFALKIGGHYLTAGTDGMLYVLDLAVTALASVSCLCFLTMTTTVPDCLRVLKKMHCPDLIMELMVLIYRYIFILMDTALTIRTAQKSRLSNRTHMTDLNSFSKLVSSLFLQSIRRARAQFQAIESRCYDGHLRLTEQIRPAGKKDFCALIVLEAVVALIGRGEWL